MPDEIKPQSEGLTAYVPLIIPTLIAIAVIYFLFLSNFQDQIYANRNDLAASNIRIDNLSTSKVDASQIDGRFSLISSNFTNLNISLTLFAGKLSDFIGRTLILEGNATTTIASVNTLNQHLTTTDGNITSLFGALSILNASSVADIASINIILTDLQTRLNSTYGNYTDMLGWASNLTYNQTDMRGAIDTLIDVQAYLNNNQSMMQGNQTLMNNKIDIIQGNQTIILNQQAYILGNQTLIMDRLTAIEQMLCVPYPDSSWC